MSHAGTLSGKPPHAVSHPHGSAMASDPGATRAPGGSLLWAAGSGSERVTRARPDTCVVNYMHELESKGV